MSDYALHDTIVALSTPSGKSGIAVIRVSGVDAIRIVASIVGEATSLITATSGSSRYLNIVDRTGITLDSVVIGVYRAPRSYTGEDLLEISCHGSLPIVDSILQILVSQGCRNAEPGEFSRRAFFHGKLSFEEVELLQIKLYALDAASFQGGAVALKEKFDTLRLAYSSVLHALALVDAQIDFGESDDISIEGLDKKILATEESLLALQARASGKSANSGHFTVALVGPPNVGKSSLFNALLNFQRSIVSETPGTTRDYLEAFIDLGAHRVKLVDTAGDRIGGEEIESEGIRLGKEARSRADLSLLITDPLTRNSQPDTAQFVVHNKIDIDRWAEGVTVSAKSGIGLANLRELIIREVQKVDPMTLAVTGSEAGILSGIVENLKASRHQSDLTLIAEDLRLAIGDLASLLGFNVSEDTLNHIFQSMCIGK